VLHFTNIQKIYHPYIHEDSMKIVTIQSKKELREFIEFPYQHYHKDPIWVAPLRSEQWSQFDPDKNRMLDHCKYTLFLVKDQDRVLGRISAFIDHMAVDAWKQPIGLFGSYECIADAEAAHLLLDAACTWLQSEGMKAMRGPWSFASQEWGLVLEGFTPPPVILAPYNPPYYNEQLTAYGMQKVKDLLVYYADAREGYQFPERFLTLTDKIQQRYQVSVRPVNMKELEKEVVTIVNLANRSIANNWGFYPVTEAEGRSMAHDMKDIINPAAVLIAEDAQGQPVGFAMSLPDVNLLLHGLNGRLLPFGWLKLLFGLPRIHQYRMWALGVIPEYHGKAIDSLLYRKTYEALYSDQIRMEINYVLEDNFPMNNALLKMGVKPLRRYRIYEKPI
jgi:ribosomal protein S18 acetylase RimI-like enzyme